MRTPPATPQKANGGALMVLVSRSARQSASPSQASLGERAGEGNIGDRTTGQQGRATR